MTEYDYICLCKVFDRLEARNVNELVTLENTYQIFRRFDEYDLLTLLEAKIYQNCLNELQKEILKTCDFLMKYNYDNKNKEPGK